MKVIRKCDLCDFHTENEEENGIITVEVQNHLRDFHPEAYEKAIKEIATIK
jgi:hypothetical protein